MSARWHTERTGAALTLSTRAGARADVMAEASWPLNEWPERADAFRLRLAHQIRQDLWRRLQRVRGLTPVVTVATTAVGVDVQAGAMLSAGGPKGRIADSLQAMLADPTLRQRWIVTALRAGRARRTGH